MASKRDLIALIVWLCEGTKPRRDKRWKNAITYTIEVTNSNSKIIRTFADFLRESMEVPNSKLKGQVQIHEGDDQEEIEAFWETEVGIPRNQFNKTIVRPKGNKPGKNKGTFKLRTYDRALYNKLKEMLDSELREINYGV